MLYVSHLLPYSFDGPFSGHVTAFSGFDGRRFARGRVVVDHIPVGLHTVDSLVAGPGGRIYLGVGSQTDHQRTGRRLSASVISFRSDGSGVRVEGRGLRNPFGLAFVPGTSTLLIADHGRDDLGLRQPPDEVNALDVLGPAVDFGWPGCYGRGLGACRGTRTAAAFIPAHSAPGRPRRGRALRPLRALGLPRRVRLLVLEGTERRGRRALRDRTVRAPRHPRPPSGGGLRLGLRNPLALALALAHGPDGALWVGLFNANRILRIAPT